MKKFFSALLCALLLLGIACAEGCLPEGAQLRKRETSGGIAWRKRERN